jgi:hypothetical protein
MLDVAVERETDGDLLLGDLGQGLPVRPNSFDGAVSISAVQWLCNADKTGADPRLRLKARAVRTGARALLLPQLTPPGRPAHTALLQHALPLPRPWRPGGAAAVPQRPGAGGADHVVSPAGGLLGRPGGGLPQQHPRQKVLPRPHGRAQRRRPAAACGRRRGRRGTRWQRVPCHDA